MWGGSDHSLLQHHIGIDSLLTRGNDTVGLLRFLIKGKTLGRPDCLCTTGIMLRNDLLVGVPDGRFSRITRHHFHQLHRLLYISVQREQRQNRIKQLRYAMTVTADDNGIPSHALRRKIAVGNHKTVAVSHFAQYLQQHGGQNRGYVLQHMHRSLLFFKSIACLQGIVKGLPSPCTCIPRPYFLLTSALFRCIIIKYSIQSL